MTKPGPPPGSPPPGYLPGHGPPTYNGAPMYNGGPIVPQAYPGEGYPLPGHPPPGYPHPSLVDQLNVFGQGGISRNGLLSLILGCCGFLIVPAIFGLAFGIRGIREGRLTHRGTGLSIGGVIVSSAWLLALVITGVVVIAANA